MTQALSEDPAFISAVEKAYLAELETLDPSSVRTQLTLHSEILERAVYKADRTNGGIRFKRSSGAQELEARLLRALSRQLEG